MVACTMASSAGMKMGKRMSGSSNSRLRLRMESAAKKTPLATSAQVPSGSTSSQLPSVAGDVQVVEDEEERREHDLDDGDEEKVGEALARNMLRARRGRHALRIHAPDGGFRGPRPD